MAISKRLRYEVLARDGHKCRYCGAGVDETSLDVDHVLPVVLGGSNHPSNLAATCHDCNSGKTSSLPVTERVPDANPDDLAIARNWRALYKRLERDIEMWYDYLVDVGSPALPSMAPFVLIEMIRDGFDPMDTLNAVDQLYGRLDEGVIDAADPQAAFDYFVLQAIGFREWRENGIILPSMRAVMKAS